MSSTNAKHSYFIMPRVYTCTASQWAVRFASAIITPITLDGERRSLHVIGRSWQPLNNILGYRLGTGIRLNQCLISGMM